MLYSTASPSRPPPSVFRLDVGHAQPRSFYFYWLSRLKALPLLDPPSAPPTGCWVACLPAPPAGCNPVSSSPPGPLSCGASPVRCFRFPSCPGGPGCRLGGGTALPGLIGRSLLCLAGSGWAARRAVEASRRANEPGGRTALARPCTSPKGTQGRLAAFTGIPGCCLLRRTPARRLGMPSGRPQSGPRRASRK